VASGPDRPIEGVRGALLRGSFWLGGGCLFLAMAVDFAGVVARHAGIQLLGGIEVIQLCIVGAISSAVIAATATGSHAAVHLLTSRLKGVWAGVFSRFSDGVSAVLLVLLAVGDGWILAELLPKHEQGDLLHLPIAPARALWTASLLIAAGLEAAAALRVSPAAAAISSTSVYEP
jgi:TRAP-type C4-dicarboxylate transport system permease small subunit